MKIAIDIRSTLKKRTGIGYYTFNLINALAPIDASNSYFLYSQKGLFNNDKKLPVLPGKNFKHVVNYFKVNPAYLLAKNQVIHTSSYDLPLPKKSKLVLVVHDVIHKAYPAGHSQDTIKKVDENLKKILPLADKIIVDSKTSAADLARFYQIDKQKIRLIYPGANSDLINEDTANINIDSLAEQYKISLPFILYVGTLEPRKNVVNLLKAFAILKNDFNVAHSLVICGMKGWGYEAVFSIIKELGIQQYVVFTDYVTRPQLKVFYQNADVFVYPSFYEGCGLPVLEAFLFGLPVVTSNISSTAEIAADSAMLINPEVYPAISWAILRIIKDDHLKNMLKQKAGQRAKEFNWEQAAKQTLDVFNECA